GGFGGGVSRSGGLGGRDGLGQLPGLAGGGLLNPVPAQDRRNLLRRLGADAQPVANPIDVQRLARLDVAGHRVVIAQLLDRRTGAGGAGTHGAAAEKGHVAASQGLHSNTNHSASPLQAPRVTLEPALFRNNRRGALSKTGSLSNGPRDERRAHRERGRPEAL